MEPGTTVSLPLAPTRFVGRTGDLAKVRDLIADPSCRVVSLLGPPGVGKTRLAIEAARGLDFADGVAFVSLAGLTEPAEVSPAIAAALGLDAVGVGSPLQGVIGRLGSLRMLVLIDNFEHVIEAAGEVAEVVANCAGVTVLATSRRPLAIRAERCVDVAPLPSEDGVALLESRLSAANCVVAPSDRSVLAEINNTLDGLPLALELVAARARTLPLSVIVEALRERIPLAARGDRDLPRRQRTMDDAIRWSYELLGETEAAVFRRLSVFAGAFDLPAASAVVEDLVLAQPELVDLLVGLADHSLVVAQDGRFRMLAVVREFALARLTGDEQDRTSRLHARHYLALAEAAAQGLGRSEQAERLEQVHQVRADFAQAVRTAAAQGDGETALRICIALRLLWYVRGSLAEGRALFDLALGVPGIPRRLWIVGMIESAALARHQCDYPIALQLVDQALVAAGDDDDLRATALLQRGFIRHLVGRYPEATADLEECLARRELDADHVGAALALQHLGLVAYYGDGDPDRAWELQSRCLAVQRSVDNPRQLATLLISMSTIARLRGDFVLARELLQEGLLQVARLRDTPLLVHALHHAATLAHDQGRLGPAIRLIGAADGLELSSGARPWPGVRAETDRWLGRATGRIGGTRADLIRAAGRGLGFGGALALAVGDGQTSDPLTSREREVAGLVADGLTNRGIAERLVLSERTVETHVGRCLAKLELTTRTQLASWFTRQVQ